MKITPNLWYNNNAEEAFKLYCSVFPDTKILNINRNPDGTLFTGSISIMGQTVYVINGGPHFILSPAFSFFVSCKDQEEADRYWNALTANGGQESRCGWLVDQFGVSWQIIPELMMKLLGHPDREKANRAMQAMLQMNKIDCAALQKAFDGE